LYTGGRDGLLCSWELGLPTKRRKRRYGRSREPDDDANELRVNSDSDGEGSDREGERTAVVNALELEDLGTRTVSVASRSKARRGTRPRRGSSASASTTKRSGRQDEAQGEHLPVEERWEVDDERVKGLHPSPSAKFRQCVQSHTDVCRLACMGAWGPR
jgi:WD repeat-containing protein 48